MWVRIADESAAAEFAVFALAAISDNTNAAASIQTAPGDLARMCYMSASMSASMGESTWAREFFAGGVPRGYAPPCHRTIMGSMLNDEYSCVCAASRAEFEFEFEFAYACYYH